MKNYIFILLFLFSFVSIGRTQHKWIQKYDSLARIYENKYNFPHGMCRSFALQESGYDTNASRVESGYYNTGNRYATEITKESTKFIDTSTNKWKLPLSIEKSQRSISFGLFQLMGENFRILGFNRNYIQPSLEEQFYYFSLFMNNFWVKYKNLAKCASCWNTGGPNHTNIQYVKNILKYQSQFKY